MCIKTDEMVTKPSAKQLHTCSITMIASSTRQLALFNSLLIKFTENNLKVRMVQFGIICIAGIGLGLFWSQ